MANILAERINDGAASADKVSGKALRDRVRSKEQGWRKLKVADSHNNQPTTGRNSPTSPTTMTDNEIYARAAEIQKEREAERMEFIKFFREGCAANYGIAEQCLEDIMAKANDE